MITIDGSQGEGGGQILRTSLALSIVTGKPFRIEKIRARRKKTGLLRQHLTGVNAAAAISGAKVIGAQIGAQTLEFEPGEVRPGDYSFAVGTAGSATLVLQTILPALMTAKGVSRVTVEGGTHNPSAPPFDFLVKAFLPVLNRMGADILAELIRPGFYPAGGGKFNVFINPIQTPQCLELVRRGKIQNRRARALIAHLPFHIAQREIEFMTRKLSWPKECFEIVELNAAPGQGNVVMIEIETNAVTEIFSGFGEQGVLAETVAAKPVSEVRAYLSSQAAIGSFLADQLLLPMILCAGGTFTTFPLSRHAMTNIETIRQFIETPITTSQESERIWRVDVGQWKR